MKYDRCTKLSVFCALFLLAGMPGFGQGGNQGVRGPSGEDNGGAELFTQDCAVCHGADGKNSDRGSQPIATQPNIVAMSDAELLGVLHNGTAAGMPAFPELTDQQAKAVVRYLRQLQGVTGGASAAVEPTGDPNAGKILFFGKAQCSTCHMISGQGGFMAPDMTTYGQGRNAAAILGAILEPDAKLSPTAQVVEVVTKAGVKISGVVRTEDSLELTLQTQDGRYHFLNRDSLTKVAYTDHSLMPHDYATRLTAHELNDLVSYLIVTARNTRAVAASARGWRDPYDE